MASSTPNLDLTLPVGGEHVSRQIINANNVKIDEAVGPVPSGTNLQSQVNALNNNAIHAASILNPEGKLLKNECYKHDAPQPEPNNEPKEGEE